MGLILVVLLIALILHDQWEDAKDLFPESALIGILFTGLAALAGWFIGMLTGLRQKESSALAIEFAVRNVGVAAVVSATTLGRPEFVLLGALFVVVQFPMVLLLLWWNQAVP